MGKPAKQKPDVELIKKVKETKVILETTTPTTIDKWKLDAVLDILDKQYRLYAWNDQKTTSLITTNSVLFATIGFLFEVVQSDIWALSVILLALSLLALSLWLSLLQVVPQRSSGKSGQEPNIRSLRGIASHTDWRDYHEAFQSTTEHEYFLDCTRQIYGMTINNDQSRAKTTIAVRITLVAVVLILAAAFKASEPWKHFLATQATTATQSQKAQAVSKTETRYKMTGPSGRI